MLHIPPTHPPLFFPSVSPPRVYYKDIRFAFFLSPPSNVWLLDAGAGVYRCFCLFLLRERGLAQPTSTGHEAQMQAIPGRGHVIIWCFLFVFRENRNTKQNIHTQVGAFRKRGSSRNSIYLLIPKSVSLVFSIIIIISLTIKIDSLWLFQSV